MDSAPLLSPPSLLPPLHFPQPLRDQRRGTPPPPSPPPAPPEPPPQPHILPRPRQDRPRHRHLFPPNPLLRHVLLLRPEALRLQLDPQRRGPPPPPLPPPRRPLLLPQPPGLLRRRDPPRRRRPLLRHRHPAPSATATSPPAPPSPSPSPASSSSSASASSTSSSPPPSSACSTSRRASSSPAPAPRRGRRRRRGRQLLLRRPKGRMRIRLKVGLAVGVVILCISAGTLALYYLEDLDWVDSVYLSVMSVTTVGYGDRAFKTLRGRVFASFWLLVSTLAVARAFLFLAEARIDKRHRRIAKWVLHRDLTVEDLFAADLNHNGFISKSEFVIYKLKEMKKIGEKDILQICNQFNKLDPNNTGKITLPDLLNSNNR
ncbi:two pore potassium channel c-like [Iris pallida]|uniref:Two pore potassium channel c-like n=1 Tax=Iris pallida TaxID=29817 RepID=A0AAX6F262_IRIPA|nr:two pore potassium channel c-like [Iris pallida]